MSQDEAPVALDIEQLSVVFDTPDGPLSAVNDFALEIRRGECVGVVGESGAGKSQSFLAVMGLLAANARVSGQARLGTEPLIGRSIAELNQFRGVKLSMIFQDPMTSLTPHMTVGEQIAESIIHHLKISPTLREHERWRYSNRCRSRMRRAGSTSIRTSCRAACASA